MAWDDLSLPSLQSLPLFGGLAPSAAPDASEQAKELVRVEGRLASVIVAWCERHVGREFHLSAMTAAVMAETLCAPDSPRRILLQLREAGQVEVELLERSRSHYRVVRVANR